MEIKTTEILVNNCEHVLLGINDFSWFQTYKILFSKAWTGNDFFQSVGGSFNLTQKGKFSLKLC